jgi:predicted phosphodiesterase
LNQYAVMSDIHGNIWALEAVLEDIGRRGIKHIINLGDTVYGPLEPQATVERLMGLPLISIQGNEDRVLFEKPVSPASLTAERVMKRLGRESIDWLAAQPTTAVAGKELFLCHGTPASDETYLLERALPRGGSLNDFAFIQGQLASVAQPVVLCGHSHIPRAVHMSGGRLIVNPGSVGLQAYTDDTPEPHIMECGSPHARYAVLSKIRDQWSIEAMSLPYAWEKAADAARKNGRNDWAAWLERGRV